jgi:tetratricopeptide (TPR) repeat protein
MGRFFTLLVFILLSSLGAQTPLEQGIAWYDRRAEGHIGAHAAVEPISKAISFLEEAVTDSRAEPVAGLYLLKAYYFRGKYAYEDEELKKTDFNKGKELGERLMEQYPDSASYRYWYLANLGSWAEVYGIFAAAKEGVADIMKEQAEKIIALDPRYEDGGGYFMLGAVHYKSPYIPFFLSWPDNEEAIVWLRKAVGTGKATLTQKIYLANALYKEGQKNEALSLLEEVRITPPSQDETVEDLYEIMEAERLLEKYR